MTETRLEAIETKIVYLEDMVEELSQTIFQQQRQLDRQQALLEALLTQVRDLADSPQERAPASDKPPHY